MSNVTGPKVAVLYDSSYLMKASPLLHIHCEPLRRCLVTNMVPKEVEVEIGRHITEGGAKRRSASIARKIILDLVRQVPWAPECLEPELRKSVAPAPHNHALGADSETDRLMIAYAQHITRGGEYQAAIIATNDGGIQYSIEKLRRTSCSPIFAVSDPRDERQLTSFRKSVRLPRPEPGFAPAAPSFPSPTVLRTLEGHTDSVSTLMFSADSGTLLSSSWKERSIRLWNVSDGRLLLTGVFPSSHHRAELSATGRLLALISEHGTLRLWNVSEGTIQWSLQADERNVIDRFWFSSDDELLATRIRAFTPHPYRLGEGRQTPSRLTLWRIGEPQPLFVLPSDDSYSDEVSTLAFSPDSRLLLAGYTRGRIYVVNTIACRIEEVLDEGNHGNTGISAVSFGPDSQFLAWGNGNRELAIRHVGESRPVVRKRLGRVNKLKFSPDGRILAVATQDGGISNKAKIFLFHVNDGQSISSFEGPGPVRDLNFSPDGHTLIAHTTRGGPWLARAWLLAEGRVLSDITLPSKVHPPCSVSSDGRLLAVATEFRPGFDEVSNDDCRIRLCRIMPAEVPRDDLDRAEK